METFNSTYICDTPLILHQKYSRLCDLDVVYCLSNEGWNEGLRERKHYTFEKLKSMEGYLTLKDHKAFIYQNGRPFFNIRFIIRKEFAGASKMKFAWDVQVQAKLFRYAVASIGLSLLPKVHQVLFHFCCQPFLNVFLPLLPIVNSSRHHVTVKIARRRDFIHFTSTTFAVTSVSTLRRCLK